MHFSLLLTVYVAASPDLAAKAEDHLGAINASLSRTEALLGSARAKRWEGVECATRRLEELRSVQGAAVKAVAVIRSGADAAAADAQYGRVVTSRSKAERLGAEASSCFPKEAVARLVLNGKGPVASKSAKGAPKGSKKRGGEQGSPGEKQLPSKGSGDAQKGSGGTGVAKSAASETATDEAGAEGAQEADTDDVLKARDVGMDPRKASQLAGSAQPGAAPAPGIAKGPAPTSASEPSGTGTRSLATAASAAPPPSTPPALPGSSPREAVAQGLVLGSPAASPAEGLRGSELTRKATDHLSRIKNAMSQVLRKVEGARNEKDVVKLNCVSEKLQQIRQVLLTAEGAESELQAAIARDDGMADAKYSRIALARGKAEQMGSEAEECVSQLAMVVDTATEVAVEQPEQLPSIGMGNETAFGPLIASDEELAQSREATQTTIWGSGGGATTTLGATSAGGGGSAPPPPPPPLLRPPAASPYY